jgi:hypothetical protein
MYNGGTERWEIVPGSYTPYTQDEINAVWRAIDYWNDVIRTPHGGTRTVLFDKEGLDRNSVQVVFAHANSMHVSINGRGHWVPGTGTINWATDRNTQISQPYTYNILTGNGRVPFETLIVHELGHSLGMTGMPESLRRNEATRVWGDAWAGGAARTVPLYDSGHLNTPFGVMNQGGLALSRPFLSEVELAIMNDLGGQSHNINLKNFFGRSLYRTHTCTVVVNDPIATLNGMYGIGLHLVAGGNRVTLNTDITTTGYAGAGIRIENAGTNSTSSSPASSNGNTVTINPGVTVRATCNQGQGIGVLVTHGGGTTIHNHGTIEGTNSGVFFNANGTLHNHGWIGGVNTDRNNVTVHNSGTIGGHTHIWSNGRAYASTC